MAVFIGAVKGSFVKNAYYKTKGKDNTGTLFQFIEEMPDGSNVFYIHYMNRKTGFYERPRIYIFPKGQEKSLVKTKKLKR